MDTVREWGSAVGAKTLHLGGGVSSKEDSLFEFKAGFSRCRHRFVTWRWILAENAYREMCGNEMGLHSGHHNMATDVGFFPAYRSRMAPDKAEKGG